MRVVAAESVTQLADAAGSVLVAGSHGGVIAAWLGATAGALGAARGMAVRRFVALIAPQNRR